MVQDRDIVTTADQYKVLCGLLIGTIFNDLEQPLTTLNISLTVEDRDIFTMEDE